MYCELYTSDKARCWDLQCLTYATKNGSRSCTGILWAFELVKTFVVFLPHVHDRCFFINGKWAGYTESIGHGIFDFICHLLQVEMRRGVIQ